MEVNIYSKKKSKGSNYRNIILFNNKLLFKELLIREKSSFNNILLNNKLFFIKALLLNKYNALSNKYSKALVFINNAYKANKDEDNENSKGDKVYREKTTNNTKL